jgi:serine/threonine protein kinase
MLGKNSTFYNREFSPQFHDFVADCTISCGEERPGATALLQHPWIKQLRKTSVTLLTLLHSVKPVTEQTPVKTSLEEIRQDEDSGLVAKQMQGLVLDQETNIAWDFE